MECFERGGGVSPSYRAKVRDGPAHFVSRSLGRRRPFVETYNEVRPISDVYYGACDQIRAGESVHPPSVIIGNFEGQGSVCARNDGFNDHLLHSISTSASGAVRSRFPGVLGSRYEFVSVQGGASFFGELLTKDPRRHSAGVRRAQWEFVYGKFCVFYRRPLGTTVGACRFRAMMIGNDFTRTAGDNVCAKTVSP